jgi:hypothetical protein
MGICGCLIVASIVAGGPVEFRRHDIDAFPAGYQVAVVDVNGDGRLDVLALSTNADRIDWYENPGWKRRPVATTPKNIDLAVREVDGGLQLAIATGFYFDDASRGGEVYLLQRPKGAGLDSVWPSRRIAVDPVTHRLRWGDLDGSGRKQLIHAPLFGPGSRGAVAPTPAHLMAFRLDSEADQLDPHGKMIDESLTVLHGICVSDLDNDGRDEILTASFEGIHRFDLEGDPSLWRWKKSQISAGASPDSNQPGAARGSSEIAPGNLGEGRSMLAAIEPWHGNQVVVYTPTADGQSWQRQVLDDTLKEGHALVVADIDKDGADEIIAGWRGGSGGLRVYDLADQQSMKFQTKDIDQGIAVEGLVAADMNGNGWLDLVAIAGRTNNLVWYENLSH